MTALEPSGPSRAAMGRLRVAVAARAAIGHPNLLRAWVIGEGDGRLFVAFERCRHRSLSELIAAAPLEPADCARVLEGAAAGVDGLNQRGLVARDLTPERVLVHPTHGGVLMDLGISPELLREPLEQDPDHAFRSPEELRRQPVDVRSGVYSLGVILFTALTGVRPYAATRREVYSAHLAGAPPRPSERRAELSPEIDAVVARAMAADPPERYADAESLSRAVTAAADLAPKYIHTDRKPTERQRAPRSPKRASVQPKPTARPTSIAPPPENPPTAPVQEGPQARPAEAGQLPRRRTKSPRKSRPVQNRATPRLREAPSKRRPAEEGPTPHLAHDLPQPPPADGHPAPSPPEARQARRAKEGRRAPAAAGTSPGQPPAQERPKSRPGDGPSKSRLAEVPATVQPVKVLPTPRSAEPPPASRPANEFGAGFAAGVRRCVALMAAFVTLAGAAGRRGEAGLGRFAASVARLGREAAGASRRGFHVVWALFLQACRLAVRGGRHAAEMVNGLVLFAGGTVRRGGARLRRVAAAVGPGTRGAVGVAAGAARGGPSAVWALFLRVCRLVWEATTRATGLVRTFLLFAGGAGQRGRAGIRRFARAVGPVARDAAGATHRGVDVIGSMFLRACRLVVVAGRSAATLVGVGAVVAGVGGRRALAGLRRLKRSAPWVVRGEGGRIALFARGDRTAVAGHVGSQPAAASEAGPALFGAVPAQPMEPRFALIVSLDLSSPSHRKLVLPAVAAIVASALSGIALSHALEPEGAPSSITRAGLTVQLPPGWERTDFDPGRPTLSSAIAAGPPGKTEAGFVVRKLSPQGAAERMLERVQSEGGERTQVRLGELYAWRYAGLRPRPHLAGRGYVLPITSGAVLMLCHASKREARVRLAECDRAATTLVVRGARPHRLSSVDRSRERLIRVFATLRSSRAEGLQRLAAAHLAPGQVGPATSLERGYQRAAFSVERLSRLENGGSLRGLSTTLRAAATAYGRLARAATTGSRLAYREAGRAVTRKEDALRRELARVTAA